MAGQQKAGSKKGALGAFFRMWCEWRDSNPQGSRRQILSHSAHQSAAERLLTLASAELRVFELKSFENQGFGATIDPLPRDGES